MAVKKKASKKPAKTSVLHKDVHDIWGWVVLTLGIFTVLAVAGYYYLTMVV